MLLHTSTHNGCLGHSIPGRSPTPWGSTLDTAARSWILKVVLNSSGDTIDRTFAALADPTRRSMVERLARGPASVSDLAAPFALTLAAIMQHLSVLEAAGLVRSEKRGRVRTCELDTAGLTSVEQWVTVRRATWERRLDRLGVLLDGEPSTQVAPPRHPEHTDPSPKEH